MIAALVQGKVSADEVQSEDLLTSTVFGHLRYLRPASVWWSLLRRTVAVSTTTRTSLADVARSAVPDLGQYQRVRVVLWPQHASLGEPDVVVCFEGEGVRAFVLAVEVKLWSPKSGGTEDQLVKYWRALLDPSFIRSILPDVVDPICGGLVYLTVGDATEELRQSADAWGTSAPSEPFPAYSLRWSDVGDALHEASDHLDGIERNVAADLLAYLTALRLRPFRGFAVRDLPLIVPESFYRPVLVETSGNFAGFRSSSQLEWIEARGFYTPRKGKP